MRFLSLVLACLVGVAPPVSALDLELHLASRHLCHCGQYNEANLGLGVASHTPVGGVGDGWVAGGFRNSLDRTTLYVGALWRWRLTTGVVGELAAGVVTGYDLGPGVLPAVIPRLRLGGRPGGVLLTLIPGADAALGLSAVARF